eukprot:1001482-Alexandrium_andersonii.AAC.1
MQDAEARAEVTQLPAVADYRRERLQRPRQTEALVIEYKDRARARRQGAEQYVWRTHRQMERGTARWRRPDDTVER